MQGGVYATPKKRGRIIGGVVDLKCRRVCRRLVKKRISGVIVAKEIYGEEGGGVVDANCYCKGGGVYWIQEGKTKSNLGDRGSWRKIQGLSTSLGSYIEWNSLLRYTTWLYIRVARGLFIGWYRWTLANFAWAKIEFCLGKNNSAWAKFDLCLCKIIFA